MTENMAMAVQAIRNFVYFTRNYPSPKQMCNEIWGGCDGDHFYKKMKEYDFDMTRFFLELSFDNQSKFAEWIMKNYDCGWNKYHGKFLPEERKPNTYILLGEEAASWYAEDGIEELLKHSDEFSFDIAKAYCRDSFDKQAYFQGLEDGNGWDGAIEITEEDYKTIVERVGLL